MSSNSSAQYKEEYIRNWIETEILYQISEEKNLLNENNYNNILKASGKELAASIAINEYLEKNYMEYSESDLKKYFIEHKLDYSFSEDAHILNYIAFSNEESAIKFRNSAISDGWQKSLDILSNDTTIIINLKSQIFKFSELQSKRIMRVLEKLFNTEISLVIKTELNNFVVVQQIDKIGKNTVPKFNYVKENVMKSFQVFKQRQQIRSYLDSLIAHRSVKIY